MDAAGAVSVRGLERSLQVFLNITSRAGALLPERPSARVLDSMAPCTGMARARVRHWRPSKTRTPVFRPFRHRSRRENGRSRRSEGRSSVSGPAGPASRPFVTPNSECTMTSGVKGHERFETPVGFGNFQRTSRSGDKASPSRDPADPGASPSPNPVLGQCHCP